MNPLSPQCRHSQSGLSIVSLLGVLSLLLIIAAAVYLFLPVDDQTLSEIDTDSQSQDSLSSADAIDSVASLSPADLEQLKPVEDAEPELKRIAEQIESERNSQPVGGGTLTLTTEPLVSNTTVESAQAESSVSAPKSAPTSTHSAETLEQKASPSDDNVVSLQSLKSKQSTSVEADSPNRVASSLPAEWLKGDALAGSDQRVRNEVANLDGTQTLLAWLVDEELIRHFVAMVDNIANGAIPNKQMILQSPQGALAVTEVGDNEYVLDAANYSRYQPYVALFSKLPPESVIASYQRFYPLLQKAYAELGYPRQSFHHRLQDAVEVVLNAPMPDVGKEYRLQRPSVMYRYQDEALEAGPDVQKLFIRMGPENSILFKETLWQWKRLLIQLEHG